MKYRVLWIDDQPDKQPNLIKEAEEIYDIELINTIFKNTGIMELEKRSGEYDAVILDAFMIDKSQEETPARKHLIDIITRLHQLKGMHIHIPFVIYSANIGTLTSEQTFLDLTDGIPVFPKSPDGTPRMFEKLIELIKSRPEDELRYFYSPAVELCTNKYIGINYLQYLMPMLRFLEDKTQILDTQLFRENLRYILEGITKKFGEIKIIPKSAERSERGLNWRCNILMGKANSYANKVDIFPPLINHILDNVLKIAQDTKHDYPELDLQVNGFVQKHGARYFVSGCVFYIVEIMNYCKVLFDEYSNFEKNKNIVQKNVGVVQIDNSSGNLFCENFSGKYLLGKSKVQINPGDNILIRTWDINSDPSTKDQYHRFSNKYILF
jgi:hypothetical protein